MAIFDPRPVVVPGLAEGDLKDHRPPAGAEPVELVSWNVGSLPNGQSERAAAHLNFVL